MTDPTTPAAAATVAGERDLTIRFDATAARARWTGQPGCTAAAFEGYQGLDFLFDAEHLLIDAYHDGLITGPQALLWRLAGEDEGALLTVDLPHGVRCASAYVEPRHLAGDRDATGIDAAVAFITQTVTEANAVVATYQAATVPAPVHRATWPTTEAEKVAFDTWRSEAAAGDTVLGFRDWLVVEAGIGAGEGA